MKVEKTAVLLDPTSVALTVETLVEMMGLM